MISGPDASSLGDPPRTLKDRAVILAYLEALVRSGEEVGLVVQGHAALPAWVEAVEEDPPRFRVRLGQPLPVTWIRRKEVALLYSLDGIRLLSPLKFLERAGYLEAVFALPDSVRRAERRGRQRIRFGPREKATVTVLEGLLGARGATGPLLDLSMGGLRMRVERAVTVQGKGPLEIGAGTFPAGTRFPVLRIDQLPHAPILVCSGVVAHVAEEAGGLTLGLRFQDLGELEAQIIRQVLGRRLPSFDVEFPDPRRGRESAEGSPVTVLRHGGDAAEAAPGRRSEAPRAGRRILLAVQDDLDRAILATTLRLEGYPKIHEARALAAALDHLRVFPMDLVAMGERFGDLPAAEVLARFRQHGLDRHTPVLLLAGEDLEAARRDASEAGIAHVLPGAGDLGDAFAETVAGLLA